MKARGKPTDTRPKKRAERVYHESRVQLCWEAEGRVGSYKSDQSAPPRGGVGVGVSAKLDRRGRREIDTN